MGPKEFIPRERVLTDKDLETLADLLQTHPGSCHMGLTPDEVSTLKRFLSAFYKAANVVGAVVLTALVTSLIAILTKGFWITLVTGIKQGVGK